MSDPTAQFDYQAQPFWDEEGNYYPPGFNPRTGEWTDPAFADAYSQGFVWDAASQQWVAAPAQAAPAGGEDAGLQASDLFGESLQGMPQGETAAGMEGMDGPGAAAAEQLSSAVYRSLREELGTSDDEALSSQAAQAASDIRALLDAVAHGGEETTALTPSVTEALATEVTALVRTAAPAESESLRTVLSAETDEAVLHADQAASGNAGEPAAPPALYVIQPSALEPLAADQELLSDPEIWALAALMDLKPGADQDSEETSAPPNAANLPYAPAGSQEILQEIESAEELAGPNALRLKNGLLLPPNFDGEEADPGMARLMDDDPSLPNSISPQSLIRADKVLRAVAPQCLEMDIYLPLDDPKPERLLIDGWLVGPTGWPDPSLNQKLNLPPVSTSEQTSGLPAIQIRRFTTANPFRTSGPGSDPPAHQRRYDSDLPREQTSAPDASLSSDFVRQMSSVRLKKTSSDGTAESPQQRRHGTGGVFIDVVTPVDIPSDDIELALTSACRRQSHPPHPADKAKAPPEKGPQGKPSSSLPPILPSQRTAASLKTISPLPGSQFFGKNASGLFKPIPGRQQQKQQLSQKPSAAATTSSKPITLKGPFTVLCRMMNGSRAYTGRLRNPTLTAPTITLEMPNDEKIELETKKLQAIFFQRTNAAASQPSGRKARLIFQGGTQRTGFLPLYDPTSIGFFFFPTEIEQSRFGFWFVYRQAVASLDFVDD